MAPYILKCSVCNGEFGSKEKWTRHLVESSHQIQARLQCGQWGRREKRSVLVAYSSFYLSSASNYDLLRQFSTRVTTFVTDFVWSKANPRIGFIQFESRKMLKMTLASLENPENPRMKVDGQMVLLRKAIDLQELEWNALVPLSTDAVPDSTFLAQPNVSLKEEFDKLLQPVRIPDSDYQLALMKEVEKTISKLPDLKGLSPRVEMFRHWYLKLRTTPDDDKPIFFVYRGAEENIGRYHAERIVKLLVGVDIGETHDPRARLFYKPQTRLQTPNPEENEFRVTLECCGLKFGVAGNVLLLSKVQRDNLLKYYCSFDSRIKDIYALIYRWAQLNVNVMDNSSIFSLDGLHVILWLLVIYLCKEKIIPSPRKIQNQPHEKVMRHQIDMGFSADIKFARKWQNQKNLNYANEDAFILSILELAGKFFLFYDSLSSLQRPCLLNTRDGETLYLRDLFCNGNSSGAGAKVTSKDVLNFRNTFIKNYVPVSNRMFMTNPFYFGWDFLPNIEEYIPSTCRMAKTTGEKLLTFVKNFNSSAIEPERIDLESLLKFSV